MKAIVLAAGYATRLAPLTDTIAKPLLPVGGRPMVDWICDRIAEVGEIDAVHVVTNARYASDLDRWAATRGGVRVHDDRTTSNDDRLGAMGDIQFTIEQAGLGGDDLLIIAGDNLFEYSVADYVAFWRRKGVASSVAVHDVGDLQLVSQYGVVTVDEDDRVVSMVEKPAKPESTLASTAAYIYHREHVPLVRRYLEEGNPPDQPGHFIVWLHKREPVYAYRFPGFWLDIGNRDQLVAADNMLRERQGLPVRADYSAQS